MVCLEEGICGSGDLRDPWQTIQYLGCCSSGPDVCLVALGCLVSTGSENHQECWVPGGLLVTPGRSIQTTFPRDRWAYWRLGHPAVAPTCGSPPPGPSLMQCATSTRAASRPLHADVLIDERRGSELAAVLGDHLGERTSGRSLAIPTPGQPASSTSASQRQHHCADGLRCIRVGGRQPAATTRLSLPRWRNAASKRPETNAATTRGLRTPWGRVPTPRKKRPHLTQSAATWPGGRPAPRRPKGGHRHARWDCATTRAAAAIAAQGDGNWR